MNGSLGPFGESDVADTPYLAYRSVGYAYMPELGRPACCPPTVASGVKEP